MWCGAEHDGADLRRAVRRDPDFRQSVGVVSREIRIGPGPVLAARIAERAAAVNAVPRINRHVGADGRAASGLRPCAVGRQRLAEIAAEVFGTRGAARPGRQVGGSRPAHGACAVVPPDCHVA